MGRDPMGGRSTGGDGIRGLFYALPRVNKTARRGKARSIFVLRAGHGGMAHGIPTWRGPGAGKQMPRSGTAPRSARARALAPVRPMSARRRATRRGRSRSVARDGVRASPPRAHPARAVARGVWKEICSGGLRFSRDGLRRARARFVSWRFRAADAHVRCVGVGVGRGGWPGRRRAVGAACTHLDLDDVGVKGGWWPSGRRATYLPPSCVRGAMAWPGAAWQLLVQHIL